MIRRILITAAILFGGPVFAGAAEAASGGEEGDVGGLFVFRLIPGDRVGEQIDEKSELDLALPEGTVYLYRAGSTVPAVIGGANEILAVPSGNWVWTAEAPGYASAATNLIRIPEGGGRRDVRELYVSVVPACRLDLVPDDRWLRSDRLDVVALDLGAAYPLRPRQRNSLWIPAGRHLAYVVRAGQVLGMTQVTSCHRDEEVPLSYPEPPDADRQGLLVQAVTPEPLTLPARAEFAVRLVLEDGRTLRPDGELWQGTRAAFFFVSVPADRAAELRLEHPVLRTLRRVVPPAGGGIQEVAVGTLGPRKELEISVDFRPVREHDEATLELLDCGTKPMETPAPLLRSRCSVPVASRPLESGFRIYRFPGLDDRQYLLMATVDGEEIPGLGRDVAPYLDPGLDRAPVLGPFLLEEMHVWGELRYEGRAVPGEVRLTSWAAGAEAAGSHPTDEDLLYHLYYFARYPRAGQQGRFPEPLQDRPLDELGGLYCCYQVTACAEEGGCRTFNRHSLFTGSGRFDLDLGEATRIEISVVDAVVGDPIPGAQVLVKPSSAFHFFDGEVEWFQPPGVEPDSLITDEGGRVVLLPREAGPQRVYALREGYEAGSATTEVLEGESVSLRVELTPEVESAGTRLALPSGKPLAHARLRSFDEEGRGDPGCRTQADGEGYVELLQGCEDRQYLVIHPAASLHLLSGGRFGAARLEVPRRRPRAVTVQVVDSRGEGVSGALVKLRMGSLLITPNDLGDPRFTFGATNDDGMVLLQGVDPGGDLPVSVAPWGGLEGDWVLLASSDLGEVVPLEVEIP